MPGVIEIKRHLEDARRADKLSHAYIISGGTGEERREAADTIAALLLGCDETGRKQLAGGTHPDLIRVTHEKPATISVDDIRIRLSDTIAIRPYTTDSKLYIIDESEKMTAQAQNAVLKTIEEPPEYATIVLLTDNPEVLLETIRSRCTQLRIDDSDIAVSREHLEILKSLADARTRDIMDTAASLKDDKDGIAAFIAAARLWLRDILTLRLTGDEDALLLRQETEHIRGRAQAMSLTDIERALNAVDEAESRIGSNVNAELTMQLLLMEQAFPKRL